VTTNRKLAEEPRMLLNHTCHKVFDEISILSFSVLPYLFTCWVLDYAKDKAIDLSGALALA
jgi:hypothetical protein